MPLAKNSTHLRLFLVWRLADNKQKTFMIMYKVINEQQPLTTMGAKRIRRGYVSSTLHAELLSARKTDGNLIIIADDYNYAVAA
jgi:hypothetical protein